MLGNHPAVRMRVLHPVSYLLVVFGLAGSFNVAAASTVTISGTPPTSVATGTTYSFTPTASTSSRWRQLRFTIANKPAWASFSSSTGKLSGTPTTSNIGTTSGIGIKVTDGRSWAQLPLFAITVTGTTATTLTISGVPATSATAGAPYSFQPTAKDSAGLPFGLPNYRSMSGPPTRPLQANYRCVGVAELASAILRKTPHCASGQLALHVLEVMTAILDAAAGHCSVKLASVAERPAALSDEAARALVREGTAI